MPDGTFAGLILLEGFFRKAALVQNLNLSGKKRSMNIILEKKISIAFLVAIVLLIIISGVSFQSARSLIEQLNQKSLSHERLKMLDETMLRISQLESGFRGYIVTEDTVFLSDYYTVKAEIPNSMRSLRQTFADTSSAPDISRLEELVNERVQIIEEGIAIYKRDGHQNATAYIGKGIGKQKTAQISDLVASIRETDAADIRERESTASNLARWTFGAIVSGSIIAVILLSLSQFGITNELKQRQIAENALYESNAALEQRVNERTRELLDTNETLREEIERRKQLEVNLTTSETFIRRILNGLPFSLSVLSPDGTLREANDYSLKAANLDSSDVVGKKIADTFWWNHSEEQRKQIEEAVKKAAETGETVRFDTDFRIAEDNFIPVDFTLTPLKNESGEVQYLLPSAIDLRTRKRIERALRENEELLRLGLESANMGTWSYQIANKEFHLSQQFAQIVGLSDERLQIRFSEFLDKIASEDRDELETDFAYALEYNQFLQTDFRIEPKKNDVRWIYLSGKVAVDEKNQPVGLRGVGMDITEAKRSADELQRIYDSESQARRDAEIANRMKDEFLAVISHELRAPLNAILGWARLLRTGGLDAETQQKAFETIEKSAENQNRLIADLLDVSRIVTGKLRLDVMPLNPTNVVTAAVETVRHAAEAKDIELHINEENEVNDIIGDANRLQQIFWNLLSNAIKFTPKGGNVDVDVKAAESSVIVQIKDNGIGIDSEFLPHVFERFRQQDASTNRKHGGLGLGLALVRHLTEMHGGTVRAESEGENRGSTFTVTLPVQAVRVFGRQGDELKPASEVLFKGKTDGAPRLDGLSILVVDDLEDSRQLLLQILVSFGATVFTAESAAKGFSAWREKKPDIIVSDIGMPEEDGYSFIRRVRTLENESDEIPNRTPAIALTAFAQAADRMNALAAGFQSHVPKPVEPAELLTVIASLTNRLRSNGDQNR